VLYLLCPARSRSAGERRRSGRIAAHLNTNRGPTRQDVGAGGHAGHDERETRTMADAHTKQHDYHLVDPSPWPAIGAASAFILAAGLVAGMNKMFAGAPVVFGVGVVGVLYTMVGWWRDVVNEAEHKGDHPRVVQLHHRYGMILFIT